ncbi:cell division protein ZapB [Salisaeta longa]|uniref:cell division protein ZapB n=1 Tax=Salisaeta longa TaxID=503170 RepID=UPI0003B716AA|nr:cell division protein ZapB [Salisaeta longa]
MIASARRPQPHSPYRLVCALLALVGLAALGGAPPAEVKLKLLYETPDSSNTLPKGTVVLVLQRKGSKAQTLAEVYREAKPRTALKSALVKAGKDSLGAVRDTLDAQGETKDKYQKKEIYYLLAETPDGVLYESTVYGSEGESRVAGFDLVKSGKMTMHPVPKDAREQMDGAFSQAMGDSSPEDDGKQKDKPGGSGPKDGGWGLWLWGVLGIVAVGGVALWLVWRRRAGHPGPPEKHHAKVKEAENYQESNRKTHNVGDPTEPRGKRVDSIRLKTPGGEATASDSASPAPDARAPLQDELDALRQENKRLKQEKQTLEDKIAALEGDNDPATSTGTAASSAAAAPTAPPKQTPQEKVGDVFTTWCTSQPATMVDRYYVFKNKVEAIASDVQFRRIFREKNASGILFTKNASDPVEHWLVEIRGEYLLLPQPSRGRFSELAPCFGGENMPPSAISSATPAVLKRKNGRFVLAQKGRVS